jgi:NAD(P)-dependent dehydrogenase (short-subunit alcohol dehydrogenase family)
VNRKRITEFIFVICIVVHQAARKPITKQGLYGMSKIALNMMMRNFALDLGSHNIRVNNAELGIFPSEMSRKALSNPKSHLIEQYRRESSLCRIGDVDEVVAATLFLLSDQSSFITGQVVGVCGGFN